MTITDAGKLQAVHASNRLYALWVLAKAWHKVEGFEEIFLLPLSLQQRDLHRILGAPSHLCNASSGLQGEIS